MMAAAGRVVGRIAAARLLVAVSWAGALWVLGYIAAPAVFSIASGTLAGDIVGAFLRRLAWISIACAALMLVLVRLSPDLERGRRRYLNLLVLAMLACALVMFVGLQPAMAQMREAAGPLGIRASPLWTRFAVMHGVSQLFHLIESVLAAILVLKSR
jgi:vacuolar-type H+-ATPase subunit I/STV1